MLTHVGGLLIDCGQHFNGLSCTLELINEVVSMIFSLLNSRLVQVLELHFPDESPLVDKVDSDVIELAQLLLDGDDLNSFCILEELVRCDYLIGLGVDGASHQILHVFQKGDSSLSSRLQEMPDKSIPASSQTPYFFRFCTS